MSTRLNLSTQPVPKRTTAQPKPATVASSTTSTQSLASDNLLHLQQQYGNRAVQRLLANRTIQARLTVGASNDKYEAEADQMAAQVVNAPAGVASPQLSGQAQSIAQRLPLAPLAGQVTPLVQRRIEDEPEEPAPPPEKQEEDQIQTKRDTGGSFEAGSNFEGQLANAKTGGQSLPTNLRREFEPKFGADLSGVQLHTDSQSNQLNRAVGAQAFTHGKHIYLASGKYQPQTNPGKQLLAHELTHTLQQGAVKGNNRVQKSPATDIQRMTVKFLPHTIDTYVNPMTQVKLAEMGETTVAGTYAHKGYKLKKGETAPTVQAATRKVAMNETLNIVAHGNERQMQAGMNAHDMTTFIKGLLPDLPGGAEHSGNVDLTGCLTAWKPFWKIKTKPFAHQVSDMLKNYYPKVKVRGYEGIMHVGTAEFGIAPIEITPWAYKVGRWATYKKLYNAYMKENNKTKEKIKKKAAHEQYKLMERKGSIRTPVPKSFG